VGTAPPTVEAQAVAPVVTAAENQVNLRGGPGTNYEVVGSLAPGESLEITGRNGDSSWWQVSLPDGRSAWVAGQVVQVQNAGADIPVAEAPPVPTSPPAAPTATPVPAAPPTDTPVPAQPAAPTPAPAACDCSGDTLNCGDFGGHSQAQACFDYCQAQGRGDIHGLDQDNDGDACESLR
jgi:uncharacterized protein YraI